MIITNNRRSVPSVILILLRPHCVSDMFTRDYKTARIGKEILPFEMGYLPEFFQKKAEAEMHDTPENRKKSLHEIRELMKNDNAFANEHLGDEYLLLYILSRKHNVQKAFKQLKAMTVFRRKNIDIFTNPKFDLISHATTKKIVNLLPWRCQDGCAIFCIKVDKWEPEAFPIEQFKRFYVVLFIQALLDPMTQVNGFKVIVDMNTNPFKHLRHFSPQNIYLVYHTMVECLPGRFKEVHLININMTSKAIWFIAKQLLSEKLKNRIFLHESPEQLLNFFPRAVIPEEYGGDLKHYDTTDWLRRVSLVENLKHTEFIEIIPTIQNNNNSKAAKA